MTLFSSYLETIARVNHLVPDRNRPGSTSLKNHSTVEWIFYEGMLPASPAKWWDDFGSRATPHEGIDITYYRVRRPQGRKPSHASSPVMQLSPTVQVPAMTEGSIVNICEDFLAKTIVVRYPSNASTNTQVLFAYAHINPGQQVSKGQSIRKNDIIATIADNRKNPKLPCHLHISCIEVADSIPAERLNWDLFTRPDQVCLINPIHL